MAHCLLCKHTRGPREADFVSWGGSPGSPGNRRLTDGVLEVELKNPWSHLSRANIRARAEGRGESLETLNLLWWSVLSKARTFFQTEAGGG